jgi:hypothetical protein
VLPLFKNGQEVELGKAYEVYPSTKVNQTFSAKPLKTEDSTWVKDKGYIGIVNSEMGQPIIYEDGNTVVTKVSTSWVPGRGTLAIPKTDSISIWFYTPDDGTGAEDWSDWSKLYFRDSDQTQIVSYNEVDGWS